MRVFLIIILSLLFVGCQKNIGPNLLILIENDMRDSDETLTRIEINNEVIFEGDLKRVKMPDSGYKFKGHINPGQHSIIISVPKHNLSEELNFVFEKEVAIKVVLLYMPYSNKELLNILGDEDLPKPGIQIRKFKSDDIDKYESLDYELLPKK